MSFRNIQVVLSGNTTPLQASLRAASTQIDQFSAHANRSFLGISAGSSMAAKGVLASVAAITAAVVAEATLAAQFEREMRNVNSISKLSEDAFKSLSKTVVDMSKNSTQSATNLAKGLYEISSSGFQGAKGIQVLDAAQKAASAGLSDTDTAARAITATLNAYGLQAGDSADVSDVLFQTVNLGVVSFGELAGQIGDVIGLASAAKVPIDDVGAAIAAMTLAGISGAEATTSLNRLIQNLIQPSDELTAVLNRLGYASGAQALEAVGLNGIMEKLRVTTGGTAQAYLELFPDIRAARGAFALAANDGQNYANTQAGVSSETERAGATQKAYNEQMKSVSNQLDLAKNKLVAFATEGGSKMLPTLAALIAGSVELGGEIGGGLEEAFEILSPLWAEIVAVGGDLFQIFGHIISVAGPMVAVLVALGATGAVEVLTQLLEVAGALTGYLAENKGVTLGLATALFILSGAAAAAASGLGSMAVGGYIASYMALRGAITSVTAALGGMVAMQAVATLGVTAVAALAVGLGVHFYGEAKKAEQQARDTAEAIASIYDPKQASGSYQKLAEQARDATAKLKEMQDAAIDKITSPDYDPRARGEKYLRTVSNEYDAAATQIDRINKDFQGLTKTIDTVGGSLGLNREQVIRLAEKYGIDLRGNVDKVRGELEDATVKSTSSTAAFDKLAGATEDLSSGVASADDKLKALKDTFDAIIGVNLNAEAALDNFREALDDLASSYATNGKSMDAFTAKGRENRAALRDSIEAINDHITALQEQGATGPQLKAAFDAEYAGLVNTMQAAGFTDAAIRRLLESYGLVPDKLTTQVAAAGATAAQNQVDDFNNALAQVPGDKKVNVEAAGAVDSVNEVDALHNSLRALENRTVFVTTVIRSVQAGQTSLRAAERELGLGDLESANPGSASPYRTPVVYSGRSGGSANSRPGSSSQSGSSSRGGSGGSRETAKERKARLAREAEARRQAAEDRQDAKDAAAARKRQQARDTRLKDAGSIFDPGSIYQDLLQRRTDQAQGVAQAKADNSKNKSDTMEDYFKAPVVTLKDYQKELTTQVKNQRQWKKDLAKIAKEAGQDVADQLEAMGESGVDLVSKMAKGTKDQVAEMAATLRSLGPTAKEAMAEFADALHLDVQKQAEFQQNLTSLISSGQADLAGVFAAGGVEQYGDIAAAAVKASPEQLAQISADIAKQSGLASGQDLTDLISMISKISPDTGVIGLSRLTGLSPSRELGLYEQYKDVFESGAAGKLATWKADLALINSGQQPTGHATGAIIPASGTGEFYRWAEPESGGESLIPHGAAHRGRALALWAETGRLLGVRVTSSGGSGTSVTVGAGAVQVQVTVPGTSASPAQIQSAVESGVNSAMRKLTTLVAAGTGRNT